MSINFGSSNQVFLCLLNTFIFHMHTYRLKDCLRCIEIDIYCKRKTKIKYDKLCIHGDNDQGFSTVKFYLVAHQFFIRVL